MAEVGTALLRLSDVSVRYGAGEAAVVALNDVSCQLERGQLIALVGPSGAGKTTLLSVIGLLERPSGGSVAIDGSDTGRLSDDALADLRRDRIGFVFQLFHLVPALTALDNVMLPLLPYEDRARLDRDARDLLRHLGLGRRQLHLPGQLSGGEQQRVAIARALIGRPELVLADEPTGNLDSKTSREVIDLLEKLQHDLGFALVIATHEAAIARRMHRRWLIQDGLLSPDG